MKKPTKNTPSVVLSSPAAVVSGFTIGLDLGDRSHYVCVLDAAGQIIQEGPMLNDRAALTAMESLCTSSPMHRLGSLAVASGCLKWTTGIFGAAGLRRGERIGFCGSTGFGWRSMYVFMVFAFRFIVVWGVSPTTGGSAPFTRCNPRLSRRADTLFAFIASHIV